MSEKFDKLNESIESLESEVSDADLPKAKGKVALSVRMLMVLALMMIAPQVMAKGKKAKAAPSTVPAEHTLTLTSEEASKTNPWEMDLNKMMEAVRTNFAKGVDPFKEMGRNQPDLFLCDSLPKKHTDKFGEFEASPSVIFQTALLVEAGMKNHINAEKNRLKKLPNVIRLLNIAGYKSIDDKAKELEGKVKAGPANTREWHAIAMDLLDMGVAIVNSVDEFASSSNVSKKDSKTIKKINAMGRKMIERTRAQLGYHGNLDEKQWKKLVSSMLKETRGLIRLIKIIGINDAYVTPREIDFDRIPDSYHAQTKKAIEILKALENDSKPNLKRWKGLQKRMAELNEQIKKAVNMEAHMGRERHRCAQSPEPIEVSTLGMMQETRGTVDSDNPDYYSEVPQVARPLPYHCSYVDPENGKGSTAVMALKDLEERVKDFIAAGMQRQAAYAHAERTAGIVENPAQKRRFTMIANGAKKMDEILAEWMDILNKVIDLRRDLEQTAGTELRAALDMGRCNIPVGALKQAAHRGDEGEVYKEMLNQFGRSAEGFEGDNYATVIFAQSKKEAEEKARQSAISAFADREVTRPRVWKPKDGRHFIVSFGKLNVLIERLEVLEMPNGHGVCGIMARLATPADLKLSIPAVSSNKVKKTKLLPRKGEKAEDGKEAAQSAFIEINQLFGTASLKKLKRTAKMFSKNYESEINKMTKEEVIAQMIDWLGQHFESGDYATIFATLHYLQGKVTRADRKHIKKIYGHSIR